MMPDTRRGVSAVVAYALAATLLPFKPAFAQEPAAHPQGNPAQGKQYTLTLSPASEATRANAGSVQFMGTATVLIRYAGLTILTDPNFLHRGDHVHLGYGLSAQRLTDPAIELDKLPPVDLVVLSHMH